MAGHLRLWPALRALARCVGVTAVLLLRHRIHLPRGYVGRTLRFADGTAPRVYRDTVVDRGPTVEPCVLVVRFRLRGVRGWGHPVFRCESLLNTPLFVGFPGFVSKLWLAHDGKDVYRGVYEWDGAAAAEHYVGALWWPLALVCELDSIRYVVVPGLDRRRLLADPAVLDTVVGAGPPERGDWWRLVGA